VVCHGVSKLFSGIWDAGNVASPAIDKFTGLWGSGQWCKGTGPGFGAPNFCDLRQGHSATTPKYNQGHA
jgi:hypothetical protein